MQASGSPGGQAKAPADHLSNISFQSLGLHPALLQGLADLGFTRCTPIQAQALPHALAGEDIAGQAQTGTGKTAAFLLSLLHHLLTTPYEGPAGQPRAYVVAPTRELALQIHADALSLGAHTGLRAAVVYGGTGYESQKQTLANGVDLLIGTPGRLIDFFKQGLYALKHVEVLVLDEADRMFDLGFIRDIRYLMRRMPRPGLRQNFLFSATLSFRVMELAYEHMNNPRRIEICPEQVTAERVHQSLIHVANDNKLRMLVGLLRRHEGARTLVFVNTKRAGELVEIALKGNGIDASTLSGDVPQNKRERLLASFKAGESSVLVATDVAARGLHIPDVAQVINYDLPQDPEDYVHRIGRTARAGESGDAISLCCETYVYSLPDIERLIGEPIPVRDDADRLLVPEYVAPPPRAARRRPPRQGPGQGRARGGGHSGGRQRSRRGV